MEELKYFLNDKLNRFAEKFNLSRIVCGLNSYDNCFMVKLPIDTQTEEILKAEFKLTQEFELLFPDYSIFFIDNGVYLEVEKPDIEIRNISPVSFDLDCPGAEIDEVNDISFGTLSVKDSFEMPSSKTLLIEDEHYFTVNDNPDNGINFYKLAA